MPAFHYHIAMLCYWCLECTSGMFLHSNNQSLSSYQKSGTQLYTWCPLTLAKHWPSHTNCCLAYLPIISLYFFKIRRSHGPWPSWAMYRGTILSILSTKLKSLCSWVFPGHIVGFWSPLWISMAWMSPAHECFFVYLHSGCVLKPCWGCLYCFPS